MDTRARRRAILFVMNSALLLFLGIAGGVLIAGGIFVLYRVLRGEQTQKPEDTQGFILLQNQLEHLSKMIDAHLGDSRQEMRTAVKDQFGASERLVRDIGDRTARLLAEVGQSIAESKESNKQVFSIAAELHELQSVLKNQKRRGSLGEAGLELILSNILPPTAYRMQYGFTGGDKVDAVIFTKEGMIPVDAKFSLENYTRISAEQNEEKKSALEREFRNDVKKRIEETAKYIRPEEGTLPFAFMFIPAEGIYYDLLVNLVGTGEGTRTLLDYAYNEKHVIIVSPTTFAAYLQSVLYGFKAFKIEESAKIIRQRVLELGKHIKKYEEYISKVGTSLSTTVGHYNNAYKELGKVDKDIVKITGESGAEITVKEIEKPVMED